MIMAIVILGNKGSLGSFLSLFLSVKHTVVGIDIDAMDLSKYENYEDQLAALFDFNLENIVIINCVGIMGAKESEVNPYKYYEINGVVPYRLKQFFDSKLRSYLFIQVSSETVYGKSINNEQVFNEDDRCSPQHIYGLSKFISEQLLKSTENTNGTTMILRAPILLFKDQKYPNALTHIYSEIHLKGSATLFGTGEHRRKYAIANKFGLDIENLIDCWAKDSKIFAPYEVLNMPGTEISTKEFVDILLKDDKLKFEIKFEDNAKLAFSLLSSSRKFSSITGFTKPDDSVDSLVQWVRKINE
jgi:dTDP-4-dehydrorhamnose reductase